MKEKRKSIISSFVIIICLALMVEIFLFNFRTYRSLFFEEKMLGKYETWVENDEENNSSSLFINTNGEKVYDLFIDAGLLDEARGELDEVTVKIDIGDKDMNTGKILFNPVTEILLSPSDPSSHYVFLDNPRSADQIRMDFQAQKGKSLRLYEVKLNAHRPLFISWKRSLLLLAAGTVLFAFFGMFIYRKRIS